MFTLDNFSLPLTPGSRVYLEVAEARWQSAQTYHEPPVVTSRMLPGTVRPDGMTAAFLVNGEHCIRHLRQCRVVRNVIRL